MARFLLASGFLCMVLAALEMPANAAVDVKGRKLDVEPKALSKVDLHYPEVLSYDRDRAFRGLAVIEFIVDEKGEILSPKVRTVTHPAFVPPAFDALYKTKWAPGMVGGVPVASPFVFTFTFEVQEIVRGAVYQGGLDPFTLPAQTPADCPPQFRYDTPPRPTLVCEPVYPLELLLNGEKGEANVLFIVDERGRVAETKILSATKPEFGAAMRAAVEAWRFTPPFLNKQPTTTLVSRAYRFSPYNQDLASDDEAGRVLKLLRAGSEKIVAAANLSRPLKVRYERAPVYPTGLVEKKIIGSAEVEFVVDRKGRVRLPRVVSASHSAFGWAAVTAVQQWYYEPPQRDGRSVDVRVNLPFTFAPPVK